MWSASTVCRGAWELARRDLATITGFMERGLEIARDYREKLRGGTPRSGGRS